ncbi:MAG: hypothetical protein AAF267_02375 [Deinococcota bacterium]
MVISKGAPDTPLGSFAEDSADDLDNSADIAKCYLETLISFSQRAASARWWPK